MKTAGDPQMIYPYIYNWNRKERKGQFCRVVTRGNSFNSAAVEFEDGYRMVTSRNSLRRRPEFPNSIDKNSAQPARTKEDGRTQDGVIARAGRVSKTAYPSLPDSDVEVRSAAAISHSS